MTVLPVSLILLTLCLNKLTGAQLNYAAIPRWGQAVALVADVLYIQGGRTDPYNSQSYSSAPISNDLLSLSLNTSFNPTAPNLKYVGGCSIGLTPQCPAVSWHTLVPFNLSALLLFGGVAGPNSPSILPDGSDSSVLLTISPIGDPSWVYETQSWANEPMRRIHHTAVLSRSKVWIVGGEKADGSISAFSENYVFDPLVPSFTQIPSTNGPTDITGHGSLVLSDGRLLVFGGYSPSQATLIPFTTIWSLDTTKSDASWTTLTVSDTSFPSPRRAFATTLLDNGKVLIHGGANGVLQDTYADGWILDTTQNPMTWTNVSQLAQLGPRRDHFAVGLGSTVIFGFGYAQNGPASASFDVFDASSGNFLSTYNPPSVVASPTLGPTGQPTGVSPTQVPPGSGEYPSPTSSPGNGSGGNNGSGSHNGNGSGGDNGGNSGNPNDPSGASDSGHRDKIIALSAIFGVLGLMVVTTGAAWYLRKQHSPSSFQVLRASGDEESPGSRRPVPMAGMYEPGGAMPIVRTVRDKLSKVVPGIAPTQTQGRRDMLADEDTREFGSWYAVRRDTSSVQSSVASSRRPAFDRLYDSLVSLRSAGGAMLGYAADAAGARSLKSREASTSAKGSIWHRNEKSSSYDPYSDQTNLIYQTPSLAASLPRGGRQQSSYTCVDPFEDYDVDSFKFAPEVVYHDESDEDDLKGYPALRDPPPHPKLRSPATLDLTRVNPQSENNSFATLSIPSFNSDSTSTGTGLHSPLFATSSNSSQEPHSPASARHPSSIIDANPSIGQKLRRSNTWWARFSKTPLLERARSNSSSNSTRPIDFRDPNPPPRLLTIEESMNSNSPDSPEGKRRNTSGEHRQMYSQIHHGRSQSSLQTSKTADSETLERMANTMQIVQKGSSSSKGPSRDTSGRDDEHSIDDAFLVLLHIPPPLSDRPLSIISGSPATDTGEEPSFVQSPTQMSREELSHKPLALGDVVSPRRPSPAKRPSSSKVAEQVAAYERRMSQSLENDQGRSLPPPRRTRNSAYGLAPKASLFVANPDHRLGSSGDS
ncbi:hypothetical protein BDY19DRAFT_933279 [Irpex rosettiformis]|uniref:Uncharacterized protein n=1 Tax=Irpex rosettiformis TaxID=378272 RepID=A0ACB8U9M8_9APHY|nr:hypothetical protein BDY19DRAFT_933279 [Irpex rosettiformis]